MTSYSRNPSIVGTQIDEDLVMMDDAKGLYFGLNPIARKIWELLEQPLSEEILVTQLVSIYDVDPEQCKSDIAPFITQLLEHQLISIVDPS